MTTLRSTLPRLALLACTALGASMLALGCGSDDGTTETVSSGGGEDLTAVKDYLTDHADSLQANVDLLAEDAEDYYALAEEAGFDYDQLMSEHCDEVASILAHSRKTFVAANPDYEEMEGIVAGVPRLAQYDVDIDA